MYKLLRSQAMHASWWDDDDVDAQVFVGGKKMTWSTLFDFLTAMAAQKPTPVQCARGQSAREWSNAVFENSMGVFLLSPHVCSLPVCFALLHVWAACSTKA
jgi:hypothetical protein